MRVMAMTLPDALSTSDGWPTSIRGGRATTMVPDLSRKVRIDFPWMCAQTMPNVSTHPFREAAQFDRRGTCGACRMDAHCVEKCLHHEQ